MILGVPHFMTASLGQMSVTIAYHLRVGCVVNAGTVDVGTGTNLCRAW
jgi:hypothetical protein